MVASVIEPSPPSRERFKIIATYFFQNGFSAESWGCGTSAEEQLAWLAGESHICRWFDRSPCSHWGFALRLRHQLAARSLEPPMQRPPEPNSQLSASTAPPSTRYSWAVVGMLWFICFFNYADRQAIFSDLSGAGGGVRLLQGRAGTDRFGVRRGLWPDRAVGRPDQRPQLAQAGHPGRTVCLEHGHRLHRARAPRPGSSSWSAAPKGWARPFTSRPRCR